MQRQDNSITTRRPLVIDVGAVGKGPKVVVGKRIDEVKVGKLAGSSGTPKGFNDAIRHIRKKAAQQ
ncbi:hypothetical protein IFT84_11860 [Rhizobium sp. CFBP 8762]|uniref:hypothetical protein n=1 Tax=Rhizobium sp. CFBP 8762 TaxID=2775279 RepID=UPI00177FB13C|nr:hypothetical protein [Rhizobium sp. CFBP 8762]MBD8555201.1 hypothetical protein [Rhizobium sp. CFBP 8762]